MKKLSYKLLTPLVAAAAFAAIQAPAASAACANEAVRTEQKAGYLADCRAFELVTPVNKAGNEVANPLFFKQSEESPFQIDPAGTRAAYTITGAPPGAESGVLVTPGVGTSGAPGSGWSDQSLAPTTSVEQVGIAGQNRADPVIYTYDRELTCDVFSSSLAQHTHGSEGEVLLPEGGTIGRLTTNLYVWNAATNSRELVTTSLPNHPEWVERFGPAWPTEGVSAGCSRVAFSIKGSEGIELPVEAKSSVYAPSASIYEWNRGGKEKLASIVPVLEGAETVEKPAAQAAPTDDGSLASDFNSISEDGKQLYFTAKAISEREAGHSAEEATFNIYDRVEGTHTVKISATANPGLEDTGARFEGASSNGERVFFLANHGLTPGGGASTTAGCTTQSGETQLAASAGCDLYEYRHEGEGGHLTDLTPTSTGVEGANVTGVAGIASSGEYVYFTSSGKLTAEGGRTVAENEAGCHTVNLYASHAGNTSFVGLINQGEAGNVRGIPTTGCVTSTEATLDAMSPEGSNDYGLRTDQARVSPDGKTLLFLTAASQKAAGYEAAYNNEDRNVAGKFDAIYYEYHYTEGSPTLDCVSCEQHGAKPVMHRPANPYSDAFGIQYVHGGWLEDNVLNDGRVFFNSYTPLTEGSTVDLHAYEYQPTGYTGKDGTTCENAKGCVSLLEPGTNSGYPTYVIGASESGENVYISTVEPLAPQDLDGLRDLYDVREGGGYKGEAPRTQCSLLKEECSGEGTELIKKEANGSSTGGESTPIVITREPEPFFSVPPISVVRRRVTSRGLTITLRAPTAGFVQIDGRGLNPRGRVVGRGTYRLTIGYTGRTARLIRERRAPRIRVTVTFRAFSATLGDSHASWTFRA